MFALSDVNGPSVCSRITAKLCK